MATIKQIDGRTIHQIQSGQVIVDLCSVVKELIENSIDAGATSIDVRFKNQGLDLIEIQDNGTGISPDNYPSVALKHHTSKLSSYSDIASLQTFGFRGEALASLCALSVLSVTTCQASEVPKGSKLAFEPSGKLKGTVVVAAQRGTTVSVEKLFHNLPVRRRELERNIKREWHKVIALLNQYACIQTNLKFSVSQQPTKGKRIHLFSTRGNPTTRDNIINIFGAKTMTVLVPLHLKLEMQPSTVGQSLHAGISAARTSSDVHVVGHVSRPAHGDGRQTPDRQMFFVNGRPCGLPQFAKVFNEVYRSHNSSQSPFILADIQLDTDMYDVNVSPDKRSILLHDQNNLLDTLRDSLMTLFDSHDYSVPTAQLLKPRQQEATSNNTTPKTHKPIPRPAASSDDSDDDSQSESEASEIISPVGSVPQRRAITMVMDADALERLSEQGESDEDDKPRPVKDFNKRLAEFSTTSPRVTRKAAGPSALSADELIDHDQAQYCATQPANLAQLNSDAQNQASPSSRSRNSPEVTTIAIGDHIETSIMNSSPELSGRGDEEEDDGGVSGEDEEELEESLGEESDETANKGLGSSTRSRINPKNEQPHSIANVIVEDNENIINESPSSRAPDSREGRAEGHPQELDGSSPVPEASAGPSTAEKRELPFKSGVRKKDATSQTVQHLRIDEGTLRSRMASWAECVPDNDSRTSGGRELTDINADDAEEKLSLSISKGDFFRMRIAGQFNLGFIIAVRPAKPQVGDELESVEDDELLIIDQHATDEKYNFERLQATTVVQSQRLVHPKRLELTALEEEVVMENMVAIEANGFKIDVDTSGDEPVGSRCQLLALPLSRETTFTLADLEELISLLGDESSESKYIPRPSKVRKMFAMRACRSSIMIGKPLAQGQMETLVRHMGELDKPWNCPHGRPTMRHLCKLQSWDEKGWEGDRQSGSAMTWRSFSQTK
ncbi:hypothetical protein G7Z17_g7146 [Cylindrodendrum hubeiense]|uniref:DNA mismatch repair protein PMS1 n=1 Tax=Cylindrodendrum hubeiense TaxID=595255 RepID=A0A9P5LA67_9HYPO|nr:hypothetical protein G7Z17_g7146 [Cylindrodendrum hubeiense]